MYMNKPISAELLSGRITLEIEKDQQNLMQHAKLIKRSIEQRDVANLEYFKHLVLETFKEHRVPQVLKEKVRNIVLHEPDLSFLFDNSYEPIKAKATACNS